MMRNPTALPLRMVRWTSAAALSLAVLTSSGGAELLVPAYFYPTLSTGWSDLAAAAPTTQITAILNPASGPGGVPDANYVVAVDNLRAAGGRVLGYVDTSYESRPLADVQADIDTYPLFYNVDGIFLDQMSNSGSSASLAYYGALYAYIKVQHPAWRVAGNPGINTAEAYLTTPAADVLVVFEGSTGYEDYVPSSWNYNYDSSHFAHLVYGTLSTATMQHYFDLAAARQAGLVFVTDDVLPNPWDTLPAYWTAEVLAADGRLGDLNCDGLVNFADINPFVLAISDPGAYAAQFPDCRYRNGDCNHDGLVNFGDINPFVALLAGG